MLHFKNHNTHNCFLDNNTFNLACIYLVPRLPDEENIGLQSYVGRNLIMISPSPVAAAPPTSLSAYDPAPAIGESPTRLKTRTISDYMCLHSQSLF